MDGVNAAHRRQPPTSEIIRPCLIIFSIKEPAMNQPTAMTNDLDQDAQQRIDQLVKSREVVLFMKGNASFPQCGFSGRAIQILKACGVDTKSVATVNVLEDPGIRDGIKAYSNWPTIPQLYVKGEFVGGSDIMMEMYESGELQQVLANQA
jgi:monothiol glutaredoxin